MDLNLKGKNVLITGATRGIGRAMAETFAKEGANISICARSETDLTRVTQELKNTGVRVVSEKVDVAQHDALRSWIRQSAEQLGSIDVLIANPSAFGIGNSEADWQSSYNVDLLGSVYALETALPYLEKASEQNGEASVLFLSSALIAETDNDSAYGAIKASLVHYAKGLARRLAPKGIRVNTISPGTIYVEDGFWGNVQRNMPAVYEHYFKRNPMGRMGCPNEVARAAAFLCSPAAAFITGSNLVIDGAWTSRVNY